MLILHRYDLKSPEVFKGSRNIQIGHTLCAAATGAHPQLVIFSDQHSQARLSWIESTKGDLTVRMGEVTLMEAAYHIRKFLENSDPDPTFNLPNVQPEDLPPLQRGLWTLQESVNSVSVSEGYIDQMEVIDDIAPTAVSAAIQRMQVAHDFGVVSYPHWQTMFA